MIPLHIQRATLCKGHRWFASIILLVCAVAPSLNAQTRFAPRDTAPHVERYQSPEECVVAAERVTSQLRMALPFWPDSMPFTRSELLDSVPEPVVTVVRRCIQKFNPDSVNILDYDLWMRLYLMIGKDNIASSLAQRRLAMVEWDAKDSLNDRNTVLLTIIERYGLAKPIRLSLLKGVKSYYEGKNRPAKVEQLLTGYNVLFQYHKNANDSVTARSLANDIVAVSQQMTDADKSTSFYIRRGQSIVANALDFLSHAALLDSLRKSPVAYVAAKQANWNKAGGSQGSSMPTAIGKKASPLIGEFVFSPNGEPLAASSPIVRPTPGKVSIVVFLYGGCRAESPVSPGAKTRPSFSAQCQDTYAVMHRLAREFPEVEMTIASKTLGYVGDTRPLTPAEEADVMKSWWLGYHKLPATLVVANTEFFRIEGYDRRRIDLPVENTTNYLFGHERTPEVENKQAFLIDVDGTILAAGSLIPKTEKEFREILKIITKRPK
jgi:hypothetical protein